MKISVALILLEIFTLLGLHAVTLMSSDDVSELNRYGITVAGWRDEDISELLSEVKILSEKVGGIEIFKALFGDIHIQRIDSDNNFYTCWSSLECYGDVHLDDPLNRGLLIHELGHRILNDNKDIWAATNYSIGYIDAYGNYIHVSGLNPETYTYERTALGYQESKRPYIQHPIDVPITGQSYQEDFADMFANWALRTFSDDDAGKARCAFMDTFMKAVIQKSRVKIYKIKKDLDLIRNTQLEKRAY